MSVRSCTSSSVKIPDKVQDIDEDSIADIIPWLRSSSSKDEGESCCSSSIRVDDFRLDHEMGAGNGVLSQTCSVHFKANHSSDDDEVEHQTFHIFIKLAPPSTNNNKIGSCSSIAHALFKTEECVLR